MGEQPESKSPLTGLAAPELLNALPDGVYVTDSKRQILFWNKAAERITGWGAADVVGRNCSDNILAHKDKDGHALCGDEHCPLHRSMVTGQASTEPITVFAHRKSGSTAPVEVSVAPLHNELGEVVGGIEVFRDGTASMQDLLRAKAIQQEGVTCALAADNRVEFDTVYEPRELVGGDFYRIERLNADQYGILVADAMGHGVAAALHTMLLRSLWDDHRGALESPGRFLEVVNGGVHALVHDAGFFATAVCATYDAASGRLSCARAGHPAPLLFRHNGRVESIGGGQPALGMFAATRYLATEVSLERSDAVLLFTDGAVEIFDRAEQELGVTGLANLARDQNSALAPGGFRVDMLEQQLLRFSDSIHLPDDLTLLKLRRLQ